MYWVQKDKFKSYPMKNVNLHFRLKIIKKNLKIKKVEKKNDNKINHGTQKGIILKYISRWILYITILTILSSKTV